MFSFDIHKYDYSFVGTVWHWLGMQSSFSPGLFWMARTMPICLASVPHCRVHRLRIVGEPSTLAVFTFVIVWLRHFSCLCTYDATRPRLIRYRSYLIGILDTALHFPGFKLNNCREEWGSNYWWKWASFLHTQQRAVRWGWTLTAYLS